VGAAGRDRRSAGVRAARRRCAALSARARRAARLHGPRRLAHRAPGPPRGWKRDNDAEGDAIARAGARLADELRNLDPANAAAVERYNASTTAHNHRVEVHNRRVSEMNAAAAALNSDQADMSASCGTRSYYTHDRDAILRDALSRSRDYTDDQEATLVLLRWTGKLPNPSETPVFGPDQGDRRRSRTPAGRYRHARRRRRPLRSGPHVASTVNLMLALEEAFDVEFVDRMLKRRTFQSIRSLSDAVAELLGASIAPPRRPRGPARAARRGVSPPQLALAPAAGCRAVRDEFAALVEKVRALGRDVIAPAASRSIATRASPARRSRGCGT
jgi:hypothetical protein